MSAASEPLEPREPRGLGELDQTLARLREGLLSERNARGHWEGELSSSALSTATASAALLLAARTASGSGNGAASEAAIEADRALGLAGCAWLAANQNHDGGWGDTPESPTNVSTTLLAWMALGLAPAGAQLDAIERAEDWLRADMDSLDAASIAARLKQVYGKDHTFAVPILVACALGGSLGPDSVAWRPIPALPFELAALPQQLFRWLGLPVVSYAMPALIAIGQVIHRKRPSGNPFARKLRDLARERTLEVLGSIQPRNGGFLEATPLTSFVVMSLIGCELQGHAVTQRGLAFLRDSARADGAWPIDTNLATWVSTLSVVALEGEGQERALSASEREQLSRWLLDQQLRTKHPYTGAAAGGWAWTDLPGGVPDADDTAGALLALHALADGAALEPVRLQAATLGCTWLADLLNRDGGMPTFCRGFGKLPFDQSCPDLTAHAMRAWTAWLPHLEPALARRLEACLGRAARYLLRSQRADGAWVPLWFGNQSEEAQENPLYGTTRVLRAAGVLERSDWSVGMGSALEWLLRAQGPQGGFGAAAEVPASIEETGMALEALAAAASAGLGDAERLRGAMQRAARWLVRETEGGRRLEPQPIGLYFAQLWYSERLYPWIHALSGLQRCAPWLRPGEAGTGAPGSLD